MNRPRAAALSLFIVAAMASTAHAAATVDLLDTLVFGDAPSEKAHALAAERSDVIEGGLGLRARRLLPQEPVSSQGGTLTFSLKVDPGKLNYLTVKLWGSDRGVASGRLLLFSEGKQIGYRDQGDYDVLNQIEDDPTYPGRFVYVTLPLPPLLTHARRQLPLTIGVIGRIWPYGTTFETYQHPLTAPTRGIYAAYTHTAPRFVPPADDKQGEAKPAALRPAPGPELMARVQARVNEVLKKLPAGDVGARAAPGVQLEQRGEVLLLLADGYVTPWTTLHNSDAALQRIVREGDALARLQANDPRFVSLEWPGAGPLGEALTLVAPQLDAALNERIDHDGKPETPPLPRRQAWAQLLRDSRDYWRTHRRFYTNQSMIVDQGIYAANRGLQLLDPANAFPEVAARRYLYEATGIEPWRGSDTADGSDLPYGAHYHLVTRKGLTRELGYVGGYGETILHFTGAMVRWTGDDKLRDQLRKLQQARTYFRYPLPDGDGYRAMRLESPIDNRTAHYPGFLAYGVADVREDWEMEIPALLKDPAVTALAQQCLEDHQYFALLERRLKDGSPTTIRGLLHAVDDYETVKALPPSRHRLPMSEGQPDFAWADEEDAVLVLRRGEQQLFVNLYYRSERGVNGVARIHELTPRAERLATVRTEFELVSSGKEYVRPDWIDGIRNRNRNHDPPGPVVHQAWAGERLPIAVRPADARLPRYGDWGPFVGKAAFYTLRYGDYLIGMNCSGDKAYDLKVPSGHDRAPELISGKTISAAGKVRVPPYSTVVLYLGE